MRMQCRPSAAVCLVAALCLASPLAAQDATGPAPSPPTPVEKLGPSLYRVGQIRVDTLNREISVPGHVNEVLVLEFVATARDGMKAYESAITANTDAVAFNTALLLIGLDRSHARVPEVHFDPNPPAGDQVEIFVEWDRSSERARVGVEQLLFDREAGQPVPSTAWVYTGSSFRGDGRYLADVDGTLIGFVHSPSPIIEQVGGAGVGRYGSIVLNPNLGLTPGTPITIVVKAVAGDRKGR